MKFLLQLKDIFTYGFSSITHPISSIYDVFHIEMCLSIELDTIKIYFNLMTYFYMNLVQYYSKLAQNMVVLDFKQDRIQHYVELILYDNELNPYENIDIYHIRD